MLNHKTVTSLCLVIYEKQLKDFSNALYLLFQSSSGLFSQTASHKLKTCSWPTKGWLIYGGPSKSITYNIFECKIQIKVILQSAYDCHAGQEKIVQLRNLFLLETITRLLLKKTQRFADHPKFFLTLLKSMEILFGFCKDIWKTKGIGHWKK